MQEDDEEEGDSDADDESYQPSGASDDGGGGSGSGGDASGSDDAASDEDEEDEDGFRQRNCRKSSPSSAGETSQPSINAHTNKYQCVRQSLAKAKPLKETVQKVIGKILLRRNINNITAGNRNLKRRIPYSTIRLNNRLHSRMQLFSVKHENIS